MTERCKSCGKAWIYHPGISMLCEENKRLKMGKDTNSSELVDLIIDRIKNSVVDDVFRIEMAREVSAFVRKAVILHDRKIDKWILAASVGYGRFPKIENFGTAVLKMLSEKRKKEFRDENV